MNDRGSDEIEPTGPVFGIHRWLLRSGLSSALFLAIVAAVTLLAALLAASRSIAVPLVLAVAVAVVLIPFVNWMEEHSIGRSLGALIALIVFLSVFVGTTWLVGSALADRGDELRERMDEAQQELEALLADSPISSDIVGQIRDGAESAGPTVRDGAFSSVASALDTAFAVFSGIIIAFVFLYYLLKDGALLAGKALHLFDAHYRESASEAGNFAAQSTRDYFRSRTVMSVINAVIIMIGMLLIGVPEVAAIGVVNFVGGYIPYLGGFVGGAFAVLIGISEGGIGLGLVALAIVLFVQFALENVLEPRIVGEFIDMHPLVVLIVTILGGTFGGFVGLVLAVPIATAVIETVRILKRRGYFDDEPEDHGQPSQEAQAS
jgi:predicted PurR-regulated permease PerM